MKASLVESVEQETSLLPRSSPVSKEKSFPEDNR